MINTERHITRTAQLQNGDILQNGEVRFPMGSATEQDAWFKEMYRNMEMSYPKFHKMDSLSKMAVLMAEVLLGDAADNEVNDKTGVLLFNRHSSIDADTEHQQLIADRVRGIASPAVFVYTLPNIMLGEICIRHRITGENLCIITPEFDPETALQQCELLFSVGMQQVILGWVDTFHGSSRAWMALVQKDGNAPNISQLSTEFLSELDNIPTWKH